MGTERCHLHPAQQARGARAARRESGDAPHTRRQSPSDDTAGGARRPTHAAQQTQHPPTAQDARGPQGPLWVATKTLQSV